MAIRFFFEYEKLLVQLPVNPGEIKIKSPGNNATTEIVKLGEINRLRTPKLQECTLESFLPIDKNAPYVLTQGKFKPPQFYIDFFEKVRNDKKPMRFLISDTNINMLVGIENFDYWYIAQDDDPHFGIELKEYRPYSVKELKVTSDNKIIKKTKEQSTRAKNGLSVGDSVIVNGKYFYSSYGAEPHGVFKNFEGKISHIVADKKRAYRYHITTPSGGYRGWVKESQITHK
mgnify:CR=1 FL=1